MVILRHISTHFDTFRQAQWNCSMEQLNGTTQWNCSGLESPNCANEVLNVVTVLTDDASDASIPITESEVPSVDTTVLRTTPIERRT